MPKVVFEEQGSLNATLAVTINREDYEHKLKTELNKFRQKAQIKGFRKGKTPEGMVRKLYGRGVLSDIINDLLEEQIGQYLNDSKLDYLGQPLPAEDQEQIEFDLNQLTDYTFKFEIGLVPQFSIIGLNGEKTFDKYSVTIPAEEVEMELDHLRRSKGLRLQVTEHFQAGDILKLEATENDPEQEALVKQIDIFFDDLTESVREKLTGLSVGDSFDADIYGLEKDRDETFVRRYLLGLDPTAKRYVNPSFTFAILEVTRVQLAELDQAFFDQAFGEDRVHSEAEAKELIENAIKANFDRQASGLVYGAVHRYLLEENAVPLPDDFLMKWLLISNKEKTQEEIVRGYPKFAESLRWSMIRGKLVRENELDVHPEEIEAYFFNKIRGMFGSSNLSPELANNFISRFMEDEKQVDEAYERIIEDKVAEVILQKILTNPVPIEFNEFRDLIMQKQLDSKFQESIASDEEE